MSALPFVHQRPHESHERDCRSTARSFSSHNAACTSRSTTKWRWDPRLKTTCRCGVMYKGESGSDSTLSAWGTHHKSRLNIPGRANNAGGRVGMWRVMNNPPRLRRAEQGIQKCTT